MRHASTSRVRCGPWFYPAFIAASVVLLIGLYAAHHVEVTGHVITGMNNSIVWGLPHVFALFLIVAASGALNVASIGSVFAQQAYKDWARLSALLCNSLLAGGLLILTLDLGRPERFMMPGTHFNPTSLFAWNVILYSGMFTLVLAYSWAMFERRLSVWTTAGGIAALAWRIMLTTGTGSIFAFLVAREAYASALLPPMFIVLSFGWGLAVFLLVQALLARIDRQPVDADTERRMTRLLGVYAAASLYFVAISHLVNGYNERGQAFERFILLEGMPYAPMFWIGFVLIGCVIPMVLLFGPRFGPVHRLWAAACVIVGAFAFLYVFVIGGQAYPLELFPGATVSSSFLDGVVAPYQPSVWELMLGLSGLGAAAVLTLIGLRVFEFMPAPIPPGVKAERLGVDL